jgi:glutamate-1-semialdehyde 2,1-aminomutase
MSGSESLFERAKKVIPGGVNSPVRAFLSVGGTPRFITRADGASIWDEEGVKYTDYVGSWGPMILGHNHPEIAKAVINTAGNGLSFGAATRLEVEMAELLCEMIPCADMVRMVNSGTEAVMSAVRAARGFTGRSKIVKFDGCYHGHSDAMLIKAGSGLMTGGVPGSRGVPESVAADTLCASYNNVESVEALLDANPNNIAAVIVEPVAANMGVVLPKEGFLRGLKSLCQRHGALLIFDEVITGFRLSPGGAQEYYGITPDLATFGKIIGAGMPVGAYAGRREIMQTISPLGDVYQAGTLSGNPAAMAAGLKQLAILKENPGIYGRIEKLGKRLHAGLAGLIEDYKALASASGVGSLACLFFAPETPKDYESALLADRQMYARYFNFMLQRGIYLAPAQFEAIFISNAHTEADIDYLLECTVEFMKEEMK